MKILCTFWISSSLRHKLLDFFLAANPWPPLALRSIHINLDFPASYWCLADYSSCLGGLLRSVCLAIRRFFFVLRRPNSPTFLFSFNRKPSSNQTSGLSIAPRNLILGWSTTVHGDAQATRQSPDNNRST